MQLPFAHHTASLHVPRFGGKRFPCALLLITALGLHSAVRATDFLYDYTSFDNPNTPGADPHFGQTQFDVLNYPSINGNYMMTSTDNHRPEMVAHNNNLAEFYNNFLADYNLSPRPTAAQEADNINAYTLNHSNNNGPRWVDRKSTRLNSSH